VLECSKLEPGRHRPFSHGCCTTRLPFRGELVLLNVDVNVDGSTPGAVSSAGFISTQIRSTNVSLSTGPKAEGERNDVVPHPYLVLSVDTIFGSDVKWSMEVLVCRSYSGMVDLSEHGFNKRLPLPPPHGDSPLPTPKAFGEPVDTFFAPQKYTWVIATIRPIDMGRNGWVRFGPRSNLIEHS
jgi:hypothetical protein